MVRHAALVLISAALAVSPVAICQEADAGQEKKSANEGGLDEERIAPPPAVQLPDLSKLPVARVLRVAEADSLVVSVGGRGQELHLLGVKTPAEPENLRAARDFLENLLKGEQVYVRYAADPPEQDGLGRYPAFVYRAPDGLFVNLELIRQGYATLDADQQFEQREVFEYYFRQAREAGRGQWAARGSRQQQPAAVTGSTQPAAGTDEATDDPTVYVTRSGRKYHRADCPHIKKGATPIRRSEAKKRGLEPCSRCRPP